MTKALGMIEVIGLSAAITALDEACDTAEVTLIGYEKVIGAGGAVSVTIQLAGDVAAVRAAVDAGEDAANKQGKVISSHVIPKPAEEIEGLIAKFEQNLNDKNEQTTANQEKGESSSEAIQIQEDEPETKSDSKTTEETFETLPKGK